MINKLKIFLQKKNQKRWTLVIFSFLFISVHANRTDKANAAAWLSKKNNKGFIENKGQMMDMDGNPIPFILFKTEAPGLNYWITEQGITIQTLRIVEDEGREEEEEEQERKKKKDWDSEENRKEEKITVSWERIDVELKNASIKKENIITELPHEEHYNYFFPHCPDGIYGVKSYEKITISDIYPGIDWVFYRKKDGSLKYDFIVHPGAEYKQIELLYKSQAPIKINKQGELELYTKHGNVKENSPVSFYNGAEVKTRFVQQYQTAININEDNGYETSIKFNLTLPPSGGVGGGPLIIDPQLTWATFYGGNGDDGAMAIDTDNNGNVFVTGYTTSLNFPTYNPGAGAYFQGSALIGSRSFFILKFNNTGTLLWATYYGGDGVNNSYGIVADNTNNIYITGYTSSTNFPIPTTGPVFQSANAGGDDVFIVKFDNAGNRLWATYYGGSSTDNAYSIDTDANGDVYIVGHTYSGNFPVGGAGSFFQGTNSGGQDGFIVKFDNAGNPLWATYCGGSMREYIHAITADNNGDLIITGRTESTDFPLQSTGLTTQAANAGNTDAFIVKFDNMGNYLWGTYYGGSHVDMGHSVASDQFGNVFVAGTTYSTDFPTKNAGGYYDGIHNGNADAFIIKFDNSGNLLWATYYGGSGVDYNFITTFGNLAIDDCGNVYFCFETTSNDLGTLAHCNGGYFDNIYKGGHRDLFLVQFSNSGNLLWATYIGGNGNDFRSPIALDNEDNLFITGEWANWPEIQTLTPSTYPLTNPGGSAYYYASNNGRDDIFMMKFNKIPPSISTSKTDANCICDGTAQVVSGGNCAQPIYKWYDNTWATIGTDTFITNVCPGIYSIVVNDTINCTVDTAHVSIVTNTINPINTTEDITICFGSTYTLPGGNVVGTPGIYTSTLTSAPGCDSIITTRLAISTPINTSEEQRICSGDSIVIHNSIQHTSGIYSQTYTAIGGCDSISTVTLTVTPIVTNTISVTTCGMYTHNAQNYTASGVYTQTLTSAPGCDSILTIYLTIPVIQTYNTIYVCQGESAIVHNIEENQQAVYTQSYTASNGCDSISEVMLNYYPSPTANMQVSPNPTETGTNVNFINLSSGASIWQWDFGDVLNSISSQQNPTFIYTESGHYEIQLIVKNSHGCTDTSSQYLFVEQGYIFWAPNTFTPNGDNHNEVFLPQVEGINPDSYNIYIYDRWGNLIFHSTDPAEGWDGRANGGANIAQIDTYVWLVTLRDLSGIKHKYIGNVNLLK